MEPRRLLTGDPWGASGRLIRQDLAAQAFPGLDGTGQTIAIIDTGIDYNHPGLGGGFGPSFQVVGGYDFQDNDADPLDLDGHGTNVAGMIGSQLFDSGGFLYRGIAPGAKLIALRVSQSTGEVDLTKIEDALQWVIDHQDEFGGIDAVNISFGYGRFTTAFGGDVLEEELAAVRGAGIFVTTSSGNGGTDDGFGITYPASDPNTISVGAVDSSDVIADFTQRSGNLSLLATGKDVRTTGLSGTFSESTGTSFAAPIVAGLIALIRQADAAYTYGDVISILRASARANLDGDAETGAVTNGTYARVDVFGALALATMRAAGDSAAQAQVGFAGNNNSVAVDDQGVLHLVYFDSDVQAMKYATRQKSAAWSAATVVDASNLFQGQYLSMQLDRWGRPHVAYFDGTAGDLKYALLDSTASLAAPGGVSWKIDVVDAIGSVGLYPSIVLDSNDTPHISYYRKSSSDLRLASRYPTSDGHTTQDWRILDVDTTNDTGRSGTITLDRNGRLVVAYESSTTGQVRLARQTNVLSPNFFPTWAYSTVFSSNPNLQTVGAGWISLAIDTQNRAHLSYYNIGPADLYYAMLDNSANWTVQAVATKKAIGQFSQLYLEGDLPRILFQYRVGNTMLRATQTPPATWVTNDVALNAGRFIDLGPDASRGRFVYSYYDTASAKLLLGSL